MSKLSLAKQRVIVNSFFFGHPEDPTPEELRKNVEHAKAMGWDKLKYYDPKKTLIAYGKRFK